MPGKFSVEAIFKAVDRITAPVAKMESRLIAFNKRVGAGLSTVDKVNSKVHAGLKKTAVAAVAVSAATAAAVRDIVMTGAEFDRTLVGAAAKFDPALKRGTKGFEQLRQAAEDIGANTEFNAQQAAQGLKDLASAGFSAEQAIASLPGVVDLATASEVDLGAASEMATKALGAFGLKVEDSTQLAKNLTKVTDVMAEAAGKTSASMEGLFESIKEGAPIAVTAGASMETFIAMASAMAGAGIEGSVAGTTLKNVFLSLSAPTDKAANQLRKFGIKTKDAKGNLRDVIDIFGELETALAPLGTAQRAKALEAIFGKIPIAGVSKMLELGSDKLGQLRKQLEASDGATKKMAETMRDTVMGDIDGFSSAIDGVKIALFSTNNGPIREVIQSMTKWVQANKKLIVQKVGDAVKWIGDNLPEIWKWLVRIGKAVAFFYAFAAAVKVAQLAIIVWTGTVKAAAFATKGWRLGLAAVQYLLKEETTQLDLFGNNATKAGGGLAKMREGLNANALATKINGVTSLLGKAGLLGAALAVGYAFGTWLDHTFKLSDKLADLMGQITGLNDKLGERHGKRGIQPGEQHLAGGTVKDASGNIIKYGVPTRALEESEHRKSFLANEEAMSKMRMNPAMRAQFEAMRRRFHPELATATPQVASPQERTAREISETTETTQAEVTIRDETGKAEVTKKPKRGKVGIKLQPTGAL